MHRSFRISCWIGAASLAAWLAPAVLGGQETAPTSSWLSRFNPWQKTVPEAQKDEHGQPVTDLTRHADAHGRIHAEADWKRRAEICQKLRQIAAQTGDAELERFAERLDQRAWDAYMRQLGQAASSGPAPADLSSKSRPESALPTTDRQPARTIVEVESPPGPAEDSDRTRKIYEVRP